MAACHPSRSDTCLCWLTLHRFMQSQNNNHGNPWNTKFVYFRMNALYACGSWGPIKPVWIWNHFLERKQPCRKPNQRTCILLLASPDLDKFKFSQNNKTLTDQILIKFTTYSRKPTVFSDLFFLEVLQCSCLWIIACLIQKNMEQWRAAICPSRSSLQRYPSSMMPQDLLRSKIIVKVSKCPAKCDT